MTILIMVNYEWFEEWKDTTVRKRGDDYYNYKMRFANNAFNWACTLFPKIKDKVGLVTHHHFTLSVNCLSTFALLVFQLVFQDVATPLTNMHYLGAQRGSMYSAEHNLDRFQAEAIARNRCDTPVKNLYISGM